MLSVPAALAPQIETIALLSGSGTPLLFAAFVRYLLGSGEFAALIGAKRAEGARRQQLAALCCPPAGSQRIPTASTCGSSPSV